MQHHENVTMFRVELSEDHSEEFWIRTMCQALRNVTFSLLLYFFQQPQELDIIAACSVL